MEPFFEWDVIGWIIALAAGVGIGMVQLNEALTAKIFFAVAAAVAAAKLTEWGRVTTCPLLPRWLILMVFSSGIVILLVESFRLADRKVASTGSASSGPTAALGTGLSPSALPQSKTGFQAISDTANIPEEHTQELSISRGEMTFRVYREGGFYRWKLKAPPEGIQSVHLKCEWAQPLGSKTPHHINGYISPAFGVQGNFLSRPFDFARIINGRICLGENNPHPFFLNWPTGDPSPIEQWIVSLKFEPIDWAFRVPVKWHRGSDVIEFIEDH